MNAVIETEKYEIRWFNSASQRVEIKTFEGVNSWEDAQTWARENLENCRHRIPDSVIRKVY